jgi:hypothetical protein
MLEDGNASSRCLMEGGVHGRLVATGLHVPGMVVIRCVHIHRRVPMWDMGMPPLVAADGSDATKGMRLPGLEGRGAESDATMRLRSIAGFGTI